MLTILDGKKCLEKPYLRLFSTKNLVNPHQGVLIDKGFTLLTSPTSGKKSPA